MEGSSQEHPFGIPFQTGAEIRSAFYRFFADRQHVHVPSSSVAQHDDPTLLFTNAGMNQFKAAFLGDNRQNWKRVYNSQKCMRVSGKHNDLDEVGADGTHHTFFEMLGNWSFGDYGKKEAIQWAWEFLTEHLKMPKNRLFATVHPEDHEAAQIWQQYTDIESWRILRFEQENFWEMGAVGPCGPSSEIFFDLGDAQTQDQTYNHPEQGVNGENPRYVEVWNLVFIQYERLQDRSLQPLPMLHVDTGSGLERLSMVVQGKQSNYDTDLFTQTLQEIEAKTGCRYPGNGLEGKPFRVICDHLRALSFAIADGVMPANEGRGYVMRRILRRACRYAHLLGQKAPFIYELVPTLVAKMRDAYPELGAREATIVETIRVEEERFLKTLDQGLGRFDKMVADARAAQAKVLDGAQAFLLHDTYGFPADLTQLLAEEQGFQVDQQGFDACMQEQRTRARAHAKFDDRFTSEEAWTILAPQKSTQFLGYEVTHVQEAKTLRYMCDEGGAYVVFDRSPFYAESGGQVGDRGWVTLADGTQLAVVDTKTSVGLHWHRVEGAVRHFSPQQLASVSLQVDEVCRAQIRRNHSATHLLHSALRHILGAHVEQQGSHVDHERIRFDFTSPQGLTGEQERAVEDLVNQWIWQNHPIETRLMSLAEAKQSGAMALFGEKYGDTVRVLQMGEVSRELCGGTHAMATGEIGLLRIVSESSVAAGVRRVEAITGQRAVTADRERAHVLREVAQKLKTKPEHVLTRVDKMSAELKDLNQQVKQAKAHQRQNYLNTLISKAESHVSGAPMLVTELDAELMDAADLQSFLDQCADKMSHGIAFLTHTQGDNVSVLACVGKQYRDILPAGGFVKHVCATAGGRGGGRADKARGGVKGAEHAQAMLREAKKWMDAKLV